MPSTIENEVHRTDPEASEVVTMLGDRRLGPGDRRHRTPAITCDSRFIASSPAPHVKVWTLRFHRSWRVTFAPGPIETDDARTIEASAQNQRDRHQAGQPSSA